MTRVATIPLQRTLASAITRSQENLATSQLQLTSGKKATDYAGLGLDAVRTLSARSMLAQQESYKDNAGRVSTTLSLYDANLNQVDSSLSDLSTQLLSAIGTGDSPGLQAAIESAFGDLRTALNANEGGIPLFAGSQTSGSPFLPKTLQDTVGLDAADAFANDDVRQSTRVGENIELEYGIGASDVATNLIPAFRTLAEAGPFGEKLTDTQKQAITDALAQLDTGVTDLRNVNATNGRNQNKIDNLTDRADDRINLFKEVIGSVEDADLGQVAIDITQRQTILEASYSVFAQLNSMSLAQFLK
ncbi:flagellar hook-associated protein 3 FlgL [Novosphingobium sp. PhB57]|jgi:flagellar hook-associated protein 3 FlgL|uniref:flagellin n=1 Tax=unclassified Novosphingobium TaxID=2644732 RepID=UPI00104F971C|nr:MULTISPECIES: flagellin [unclassified Novosphingobium]TCU56139.1 flagellar hook-associated protein 3 FlgL [Novosphingobium sp. PhB57]TDW65278.1 flagellar hook-associated protein 3 FlgL [Novosphingobium sp. PhB55]